MHKKYKINVKNIKRLRERERETKKSENSKTFCSSLSVESIHVYWLDWVKMSDTMMIDFTAAISTGRGVSQQVNKLAPKKGFFLIGIQTFTVLLMNKDNLSIKQQIAPFSKQCIVSHICSYNAHRKFVLEIIQLW